MMFESLNQTYNYFQLDLRNMEDKAPYQYAFNSAIENNSFSDLGDLAKGYKVSINRLSSQFSWAFLLWEARNTKSQKVIDIDERGQRHISKELVNDLTVIDSNTKKMYKVIIAEDKRDSERDFGSIWTKKIDGKRMEGALNYVGDLVYAINAFWETLKPVALTVILASLACNYIVFFDENTEADKESGMEVYTAGPDADSSEKIEASILNAIIIVTIIQT